jgi:hypothetical protein
MSVITNNEARSDAAYQAVIAHGRVMGNGEEELETRIVDLMSDLMHLCAVHNYNIENAITRANSYYEGELDDEIPF